MKKDLVKILYQPTGLHTCRDSSEATIQTRVFLSHEEHDLLEIFERLIQSTKEIEIEQNLLEFHDKMIYSLESPLRYTLLKEYNGLLERFVANYGQSYTLFRQSLRVILQFKNAMTNEQSPEHYATQAEWIELERSLYLLCEWDREWDQPVESNIYMS